MSEGFIHSIKVPRVYKAASVIVKRVIENNESLKQLIYEKKHLNIKAIYALTTTTIQHASELNEIVRKTQLFFKEPRLDPWLARVLITELFWGKQSFKSDAKPIQTILNYENQLREELKNINITPSNLSTAFSEVRKPRYIRINTLMMSIDEAIAGFESEGYTILPSCRNYKDFLTKLQQLSQYTYIQDFHIPELFAFAPGTEFHDHYQYQSGAIILQDKASCFPAHLLNPRPASVIVDMCAAPGMKTTHLAAKIKNIGTIYSVERDERRYDILCSLVNTTNATCVNTIKADALTLNSDQCPDVEYILVDPSCSGSGMKRLECVNIQEKCAPLRLKSLQSFQVLLLRHSLLNFPKVKRVVYSTCSIYPEENEMVVDEILSNIGDAYKLVPIKSLLNNEWLHYSSNEYKCGDNCLYARPDVDMTNGFFVAVFERNFNVPLPEYVKRKGIKRSNTSANINETDDVKNDTVKAGDEETVEKKKRKKKKKTKEDSLSKYDENNPDETDSVKIKKKKKKDKKENTCD